MIQRFLFCLLLLFSLINTPGQMPGFMNNPMPNMGNMNASELAELEALEKELARAAQEIDQYVASLSPEEQEQFHQAVKEVESMLENMSEDEFNQMLNQMFQEPDQQATLTQPDTLTPPKVAEPVITKPALTVDEARKQDTALQLLENLTRYTNSFMVKTQAVSEIPGSVDRWALQGRIAHWPAATTWSNFEKQIELLNQRLYLLLDKDEASNKFRYLLDLVADEKTFTVLFELEKKLAQNEPIIETPSFGSAKMNTATKNALKNVVSAYSTAFYAQNIIKAIDTIIEKYGPIAKKLQDDETQRAERAKQEAAKPIPMGRTALAGRGEQADSSSFGGSPDFGGGYAGGYNPGYYGGGSDYYPNYGSNYSMPSKGSKDASGLGGGSAAQPKATDTKTDKKPAEEKKKDTKETDKDKIKKAESTSERIVGQIEASFESIKALFDDYPLLTAISKHVTSADSADPALAGFAITAVDKRVNALTAQVKNLDKQLSTLKKEAQESYKAAVNKAFKKNRTSLEKCKQDLLSLQDSWSTVQKGLTADKLYAYFKEETLVEKIAPSASKPSPSQEKTRKLKPEPKNEILVVDERSTDEYAAQYEGYLREKERLETARNNSPKGASTRALDLKIQGLAKTYFGVDGDPLPPIEQQAPHRPSNLSELPPLGDIEEPKENTKQVSGAPVSSKEAKVPYDAIQSSRSLFDLLESINALYTALNKLNVK